MKISKISNYSFGHLYQSKDLLEKVSSGQASRDFLQEYANIRNIISENGLDRKKNVDILLHHNEEWGFKAIISPKKEATPHHPKASLKLKTTEFGIAQFKNWVNSWNSAYSPMVLKEMKQLDELIESGAWIEILKNK